MDLEERLKTNIVAPMTFEEWEIGKFVDHHRCHCGSHLIAFAAPGRKYYAKCPEHGAVTPEGHITKGKAQAADQGMQAGLIEIRPEPQKRNPDDLLRELGF